MQCKHFFLTYKQCLRLVDKNQVKELLLAKTKGLKAVVLEVIVCKETGQNKKDSKDYKHFHCLVCFDRKVTIRNERFWDLLDIHGHYLPLNKKRGSLQRVKEYITKDGDIASYVNMKPLVNTPLKAIKGNDLATLLAYAIQSTSEGKTTRQVYEMLNKQGKALFLLNECKINQVLLNLGPTTIKNKYVFNLSPEIKEGIDSWQEEKHQKVLFLHGESGFGKTQLALSLFKNPLVVSCVEDFKGLRNDHDAIVMDDVALHSLVRGFPSKEAVIQLFDLENSRGIDVKYGKVTLPLALPRVVTSNSLPKAWFGILNFCHLPKEITRRFIFVHVNTDIRGKEGLKGS